MKRVLVELLKFISTLVASIVGPLILVILGGMTVIYGSYKEWQWLASSGMVVAALGAIIFCKVWWIDE